MLNEAFVFTTDVDGHICSQITQNDQAPKLKLGKHIAIHNFQHFED